MKYFNFIMTLAVIGLLYSCYPKGPDYVDELDTYISRYDPENFRADTFAIPDEVIYYKDGEINEGHDHKYDAQILSLIKNNLLSKGFSYTEGVDTALIVFVEACESTNTGVIYPPYKGWYPWYPGGGWYPWYPWYPGGWYPWYPSYYTFQKGTLTIEIGDLDNIKDVDDTTRVPMIYIGVINGLLQGSDSYIEQRVKDGINQLFEQAPFDEYPK